MMTTTGTMEASLGQDVNTTCEYDKHERREMQQVTNFVKLTMADTIQ